MILTVLARGCDAGADQDGPTGAAPRSVRRRRARVRARHWRRADRRFPPRRRRSRAGRKRVEVALDPDGARSASRPTVAHSSRPSAAATSSPLSRSAWTGCSGSHDDRLARCDAVRVRHLVERDTRRYRGLPRREGSGRSVELPRDGDTITPGTASVGNGRSEICWAVISNDGRYAFTTNFADGAVSRYAIN